MDRISDQPTPPPELEDRILPWSQVKVISGLSRTTVWRLQKTGDFPASVQVSRNRIGWWQSDILEWRRSRLPRRLPEPKPVPAAVADRPPRSRIARSTAVVEEAVRGAVARGAQETHPPGGRRRKSAVCENQTAFDF